MRNDKEFLEEIYSRGERYKARKRKHRKAILISIIPIFVSVTIIVSVGISPLKFGIMKSADHTMPTTENNTNDIAKGEDEADDVFAGHYAVLEDKTQIHYPNEEIDGEYPPSSNSGAPLMSEATNDSVTSNASKSESEEFKESTNATDSHSDEEDFKKADSYTLIYGCVATEITSKENTEKMRSFLEDTCQNYLLVEWAKNPEPVLTIELGGKSYSLVNNYLCEGREADGGAYALNQNQLETFRNILKKSGVLDDSIDLAIDKVIQDLDEANPGNSAPKDDAK